MPLVHCLRGASKDVAGTVAPEHGRGRLLAVVATIAVAGAVAGSASATSTPKPIASIGHPSLLAPRPIASIRYNPKPIASISYRYRSAM